MSALEHMRMFCKIKGVPYEQIEEQCGSLLKQVNLDDVKNAEVSTFSGGMKRRLTVAISAIGNPKVIFFDEPTTGMDPVSRKDVWCLMQELKKEKTIILTTHAMEEADALADRIGVVVDGQLKCVGSPLNLKNTYGDGYRITMICEPGLEQRVIEYMDIIAPSNKHVDDSGGSMVFTVPIQNSHEIAPLFQLIESDPVIEDDNIADLKAIVTDCGISHSTLEEVFMKVTGKKIQKHHSNKDKKSLNMTSGTAALTEDNVQQIPRRKSAKMKI